MRRVLSAASAVFLVAAATAAAASPPHATTAGNKRLARKEAQQLLAAVRLPAGAQQLRAAPHGDGGLLRRPASIPGWSSLVDLHRVWRVHKPLTATASFTEAHLPKESKSRSSGSAGGPGVPPNFEVTYSLPATAGRIALRWLDLVYVSLPNGWTGVRADAQVAWLVARSPKEVVPAGVRRIDVEVGYPEERPKVSLDVRSPAELARIVGWLDGLGVVQPMMLHCPMIAIGLARVTFSFRAADGTLLARARMVAQDPPATECTPIQFSIRSRPQKPLVGAFLSRVQRLLGVRLTLPPPGAGG
jgi:hypothetical protein